MGGNAKGALIALLAFGLFATHDAVVKALGGTFATFQILFFSTLLSFPLVLLMLMRDATAGTLRPVHPWWSALRTLLVVITGSSAFYAFATLPLAQVYAIVFAQPLLITVLSIPILGERVGAHRWAAVAAGLVGVLVVIQPGTTAMTLGHYAAMAAAVCGATASVIVRKIGREERSAVLLLYPMMANFALMGAVMPLAYVPPEAADLAMFGLISVFGLLGGLLLIAAYRAGDAAVVAPMQYSQILWAAVFGALFFNEAPSASTWAGAAIIIGSGLYIVLRESLSGVSRNAPVTTLRNTRAEAGNTPRVTALRGLPGRAGWAHRGLQDDP